MSAPAGSGCARSAWRRYAQLQHAPHRGHSADRRSPREGDWRGFRISRTSFGQHRSRCRGERSSFRARLWARHAWLRQRLAGRFGFYPPDRLFEAETLLGDVRFRERWFHAAQLRNERRARAFVKRAARLSGILGEAIYGTGYERVVIGHRFKLRAGLRLVFNATLPLERIAHQDGILALRTGRQNRRRATDQFLDPAYVFDRLGG